MDSKTATAVQRKVEGMAPFRVPFVDFRSQFRALENETLGAVRNVLANGDFILRDEVKGFEKSLASFLGVDYAVGVNSGTDAMYLTLVAAGIGPGDEVITVAHTYVATIAVIVHCGATPVLVDVKDDFTMDMDELEQAVTPRTKAIIPVHLNGRVCDMERLMDIASRRKLLVIEDAAQALGGTFDEKRAGSFGLAGCFSFYPAKLLGAAGDAGLVATNDRQLTERLRLLRDHGRSTKDELACFGFNSRLDNLQAAILNVKFRHVPDWIEKRRELAAVYHRGLSDVPQVKPPPPPESVGRYFDVFQNYVVRAERRNELREHLNACGIETLVSNPVPVHHQPALQLARFALARTERFAGEVLSLPLHTELSGAQVEWVVDAIRSFYGARSDGRVRGAHGSGAAHDL